MKLMIDIPEEMHEQIKDGYVPLGISKYLKNGTPLDDVKADIDQYLFQSEFGSEYRKEVLQILDNIGKAESEDK